MSDIQKDLNLKRPGGVTFAAVMMIIFGVSGLGGALLNFLVIALTGSPAGIFKIMRAMYPPYMHEYLDSMMAAFQGNAAVMYLMYIFGLAASVIGLIAGISLMTSRKRGILLSKVYLVGYTLTLILTSIWTFSLLGILADSTGYLFPSGSVSGRSIEAFSGIMRATYYVSGIIGIAISAGYVIAIFVVLNQQKSRDYFALLP
ncbi:MAG: hypothetical protein JW904_15520 [Spirochaetales bacterium]|nr:hypothetical protein [Spirochaetales bacterium]